MHKKTTIMLPSRIAGQTVIITWDNQRKKYIYMTENVGFSMFCLCQEQTYHLINSLLRSFRLLPVYMLS